MNAWNVQGGIQRKFSWFGLDTLGETAFWGGYSDVKNGFAPGSSGVDSTITPVCCQAGRLGTPATMLLNANSFPSIDFKTQVTSSDVNEWFLALDQDYSAAAMHVYLAYEHFNPPELNLIELGPRSRSTEVGRLRSHLFGRAPLLLVESSLFRSYEAALLGGLYFSPDDGRGGIGLWLGRHRRRRKLRNFPIFIRR